jgi:RES domain-containing protein
VRVWRLALGRYREIDGEGARVYGGRWNSPGNPVVYTATHISLALLEQLVHVNPDRLPDAFRVLAIEPPDDPSPEIASAAVIPTGMEACRRYGNIRAASRRSAALVVSSVVVAASLQPGDVPTPERNVLLNPRHASADAWQVVETSFRVDSRLKRAG